MAIENGFEITCIKCGSDDVLFEIGGDEFEPYDFSIKCNSCGHDYWNSSDEEDPYKRIDYVRRIIWPEEAILKELNILEVELGLAGVEAGRLIADFNDDPKEFRAVMGLYAFLIGEKQKRLGLKAFQAELFQKFLSKIPGYGRLFNVQKQRSD